jgi:hypothetical protein
MKTTITKNNLIVFALALAFVIGISGCTYYESPEDPTYYTNTYFYTIYQNDWSLDSDDPYGHWFYRMNVNAITKDIIDMGFVLVYYRNDYNNWVQLPFSTTLYNKDGVLFTEEMWFGYALGTLDLDYVYTNPLELTPRNYLDIKVVVTHT